MATSCAITIVYLALYSRQPDQAGLEYWRSQPAPYAHMLESAEPTSSDIEDWYLHGLGRPSDPGGLIYWSSRPASEALEGFVNSTEAVGVCVAAGVPIDDDPVSLPIRSESTPLSPREIILSAADEFGVDPVLMLTIAECESGLNPSAKNPHSSASGLFQHLRRYWPARAEAIGQPGASVFDARANARAAAWMLSTQGTSPWNPSRHCWG